MFISLNQKFLDKNRNKMLKLNEDEIGKEDARKDQRLRYDSEDTIEYFEFDKGEIDVAVINDLGYFSVKYTLTDEEMMEIVRHMKHKGEAIRELIKLAEE